MEGKGAEEDRDCDRRTALRETWEGWEENGRQHQKNRRNWRLLIEDAVSNEIRNKKTAETETLANLTPDDRDPKRRTTFK